ncbi:unnamed protein product [Merluccius merluccius]
MKRLYVGGLSHSITQKDLRDRFGKFGSVEDVELRTRSDDEGVPYKTFGYINITISDDDFKKCMTVLNKSKWKGGTLLIEPAKESLLQRLKQEREARTQDSPPATHQDSKKKVLDSLRSAGVENFHMKSAVPGTEVPGHKEWVVSKFGRVLPVLNLRCRKGSKTRSMKYDPSKHSHNIKRLELSADTLTSVTQLTWELPGGDDDISKKRRGEFPPTQPWRPKRSRVEAAPTSNRRSNGGVCAGEEEEDYDSADTDELLASNKRPPSSLREHAGKGSLQASSGKDQKKTSSSAEDDEDDADDFKQSDPKADISQQATLSSLKSSSADCGGGGGDDDDDDDDEDGDEDGEVESDGDENGEVESDGDEDGELKSDGDEDGEVESDSDEEGEVESDGNEEGEVASDGDGELESDSDGDEDLDYDAMFSNCTRLEVSLNDLQRLAKDAETATPSMPQPLGPVASPGPRKGTTPEEILAALLEEDSGDDVKTKKKKKKKRSSMWSPLPAFQGTSGLLGEEEEEEEEEEEGGGSTRRRQDMAEPCSISQSAGSEPQPQEEEKQKGCYVSVTKDDDDSSSEEEEEEGGVVTADSAGLNQETSSGSIEEDEEEEGGVMADPPALSHEPSSGSSEEKEEEEEEEVAGGPDRTLDPERRRLDNKRRLEAVVQRHQQNQNHRKLIQGALASLDTCAAAPGQHIVFSSDEEEEPDDDDDDDDDAAAPANQRAALKEKDKISGSKLFEDEEDEEEDDSRFQIKPQFEGRAGRRLMEIQSGFGTDDRFRMDSRFTEEEEEREAADEVMETGGEEEEGLEEERKMNLSILQSVLNNNPQLQTKLKTSSKAQTFRDVQALHYDPSRQEHAVFEDKMEDAAKEGKASRKRKKQKEVELPEVSSEIYYDVCEELKGVFGGVGPGHPGGGAIMQEASSWDRREEQQEETKEEKEEQSAFKFSFFQDETQTSKETEYQVEAIKEPRVSWQLESGFQDSSSEDDDDDDAAADEEKVQQSRCDPAEESVTSSNRDLFFYYPEDSRLTGLSQYPQESPQEMHQEALRIVGNHVVLLW